MDSLDYVIRNVIRSQHEIQVHFYDGVFYDGVFKYGVIYNVVFNDDFLTMAFSETPRFDQQ